MINLPYCNMEAHTIIGDHIRTSGVYNNEACNYEGGDCVEFNLKYPESKVYHPQL